MKKWPVFIMVIFFMGAIALGVPYLITGTDSVSLVFHDYLPLMVAGLGLIILIVIALV